MLIIAGLLALMLGPFQRIEQGSGVSDKLAHVVAFGIVAVGLLLNFPRLSRLGVAGFALMLAVLVEVVQSAVGRDAELGDLLAGGIGIAIVTLGWFHRKPV